LPVARFIEYVTNALSTDRKDWSTFSRRQPGVKACVALRLVSRTAPYPTGERLCADAGCVENPELRQRRGVDARHRLVEQEHRDVVGVVVAGGKSGWTAGVPASRSTSASTIPSRSASITSSRG